MKPTTIPALCAIGTALSLCLGSQAKKAGLVKVGESFRIAVDDNAVVKTTIVNPGNKFQNRSFIQSFRSDGANTATT